MANLNDKDVIWDDDVTWEEETPPVAKKELTDSALADAQQFARERGLEVPTELPPYAMGAKPITPRSGAEIVAMGLGGAVGGPLGAAGGYALADQLFSKYQDGKEITPMGAAKSLGMGALYEFLPKTLLGGGKVVLPEAWANKLPHLLKNGLGGLIPKGVERALAEKSLGMPIGFSEEALQRAVTTQLDKKLVIRGKDLKSVTKEVGNMKKELTRIITEAQQNGVMIDPATVISYARTKMIKELDNVELSGTARAKVAGYMDEALNDYVSAFGAKPGTNLPNEVSIAVAQARKEATQKHSQRVYNKAVKTNTQITDPGKFEASAAIAGGLRKEIAEKAPGVVGLNKDMSDLLMWKDHAGSRIRKQGKRGLISHDVSLPFAIEMAARGKPGVATASGFVRNLSANPYVLSKLANYSRAMRNNQGGPVPPAAINRMIEEAIRQQQMEE